MRFQRWQTVLLEWDSNLANSCSVIEKKTNFLKCIFFGIFHFFSVTFCQWLGKIYIDTNNSHQIVQSIVDKKDNFSFSSMLFACRDLLLIAKKIAVLI